MIETQIAAHHIPHYNMLLIPGDSGRTHALAHKHCNIASRRQLAEADRSGGED